MSKITVMGIDPGTATTGYGVISAENKIFNCLEYGIIGTSSKWKTEDRLNKINNDLSILIEKHQPNVLAVESLFFFKNAKTIIPVSQARGVILMIASSKQIPVYEYTPLQAKMATVGYGRAEKKQVQEMVKILLELDTIPRPDDAADALAIAICHISNQLF
ncbi:MAG: Crossover junction endodeoxyribonuclease RuvC [Parcubacteria group bacterium ADurb.Bin247]|jgi:crossover junction endodeoxyribonuclease RuvC|nr:MAG: Crossover junction endodeoxyribonuclease RuvC [Parcubacteria group bacterium ADurb.Bin247]